MIEPLVFLLQLISGQWDALWESCWRGKSFFLALTVSFISMPRAGCLQLCSPSKHQPSSTFFFKVACGHRPLALQSQAFLKGRCVKREKWGMNWSDGQRLNHLGCCIQYLRAEPGRIWFTDLCVLWDLLSREELLTFSTAAEFCRLMTLHMLQQPLNSSCTKILTSWRESWRWLGLRHLIC